MTVKNKYRVWEPERERMCYEELATRIYIDFHGDVLGWGNTGNIPLLLVYSIDGNDFYEGDIIEFQWNEQKRIEPVIYYPHITYIGRSHNFYWNDIFDNVRLTKPRVIGNIYNNPELLK